MKETNGNNNLFFGGENDITPTELDDKKTFLANVIQNIKEFISKKVGAITRLSSFFEFKV